MKIFYIIIVAAGLSVPSTAFAQVYGCGKGCPTGQVCKVYCAGGMCSNACSRP